VWRGRILEDFSGDYLNELLPLLYYLSMIILKVRNLEVMIMAQRRAEKPKKVKLSAKQREFYSRIGSSKGR